MIIDFVFSLHRENRLCTYLYTFTHLTNVQNSETQYYSGKHHKYYIRVPLYTYIPVLCICINNVYDLITR